VAAVAQFQFVPNPSIFDLHDYMDALEQSLEACDDPATRERIQADIDGYAEAILRKVDDAVEYLDHLEAENELIARQVKRLQDRKRSYQIRIARIEAAVERTLNATGKAEIRGTVHILSTKRCPPSVEVLDMEMVPAEYIRTTVEESVDKAAAARALKAGEEVPGLKLVTDRRSVVRK
jgi:chaperonin cofactor prefoldin